jgi:hypothetical protein
MDRIRHHSEGKKCFSGSRGKLGNIYPKAFQFEGLLGVSRVVFQSILVIPDFCLSCCTSVRK